MKVDVHHGYCNEPITVEVDEVDVVRLRISDGETTIDVSLSEREVTVLAQVLRIAASEACA